MLQYVTTYVVKNKIQYEDVALQIKKNMVINMGHFGFHVQRKMRQVIRSGAFKENSPPWAAAKGGSRPLYHTGHLSTSIKTMIVPGVGDIFLTVKVGWFSNKPHPERPGPKGGMQDIINFLTSDRKWEPKRSSVKAFWARVPTEWKRNNPPIFKPTWESPKRDFMKHVMNDPQLLMRFNILASEAINKAMRGK